MKALFIEIRGILNQYRGWRSPKELEWSIDTDRVLDLKRIVDKTGANIFLFDSWREHWYDDASLCTEQGHFLCEQLAAAGLKISGKTKRHANDDLESELKFFFFEHPEIESYAVIDWIERRYQKFYSNCVIVGQKGLKKTHIEKLVKMLNTPILFERPYYDKSQYKIVLVDHILPMNDREWEIENKYAGRFVYKKVVSETGHQDIIRIDRVEVDEEYKEVALKAELYAAKKFTGEENSYYDNWMDEFNRLMSYAFVCDRWSLYYSYKSDGFARQGIEWLSYRTLNPSLFGHFL